MIGLGMDLPKHPIVEVHTTNGRGFTVEEIADRFVNRLIDVADTAHPDLRAQANEFKDNIRVLIVSAMVEAIRSDRTTIFNTLKNNGHGDVAELVRKL